MSDYFLQNVCPIYKSAFGEMLISMEFAETDEKKVKIIGEFSNKFLLLPETWEKLKALQQNCKTKLTTTETGRILRSFYTKFYDKKEKFNKLIEDYHDFNIKMISGSKNYKEGLKIVEHLLSIPHNRLMKYYRLYHTFGAKQLSESLKVKYEKSLMIFSKFYQANNCNNRNSDLEFQWFELIKEIDDNLVIIANLEIRLGQKLNYANKNLWKIYLNFLRDRNLRKALLNLYFRYCRFFISDNEMREEYRNDLERIGRDGFREVTVFWTENIKYELHFGSLESAYAVLERAVKAVLGISLEFDGSPSKENFMQIFEKYKHLMIAKEFESNIRKFKAKVEQEESEESSESESEEDDEPPVKRIKFSHPEIPPFPTYANSQTSQMLQQFSLPSTILSYSFYQASASIYFKLNTTCKYFFSLKPYPICRRLVFHPYVTSRYVYQTLFLHNSFIDSPILQNLHISNSFACYCDQWTVRPHKLLSRLIQKLHKFDASHIVIYRQEIDVKEFKFLISSGKVKHLQLNCVKIVGENGLNLSEMEILKMIQSFGNKIENFENSTVISPEINSALTADF